MTDADIDGAHIRTLLLTFLFRQMPQLMQKEMVYIAQPPLYEIKAKGKKSEYLLTEAQMRQRMIKRGLEGTKLIVRAEKNKETEIEAAQLEQLIKLLSDAERSIAVLSRRGIVFNQFVDSYYDGRKLPIYRISIRGQADFYYSKDEFEKQAAQLAEQIEAQAENGNGDIIAEELHEVTRINEINTQLQDQFGLDLRDFLPQSSKADSDQAASSRFCLVRDQDKYEVASLMNICPTIRQVGTKGIDIKRFKGLGEMNAEQLWQTTMNPAKRAMLKVKIEDAGEADRLFSILMGENVEKRRNFIREHALDVQNLDV